MKEKIKCPSCGISVTVNKTEDLKRVEMLFNTCYEVEESFFACHPAD